MAACPQGDAARGVDHAAGLVGDGYVTASSTAGMDDVNRASNSGISSAASLQAIEPCAIAGTCG